MEISNLTMLICNDDDERQHHYQWIEGRGAVAVWNEFTPRLYPEIGALEVGVKQTPNPDTSGNRCAQPGLKYST